VHFKPEMFWDDDVHTLELLIKPRVPVNPLMEGAGPWFPHHLLCSGVARWAWENSVELVEEWGQSLGLVLDYRTRAPATGLPLTTAERPGAASHIEERVASYLVSTLRPWRRGQP
jgi:hypothetical protein